MKIRLIEDLSYSWPELIKGCEFNVTDVLGRKPSGTHVLVRVRPNILAHIRPSQYEVINED